jgi:hypothetical protein
MENHIIAIKSVIAEMIEETIKPNLKESRRGDGYVVVSEDDLMRLAESLGKILTALQGGEV